MTPPIPRLQLSHLKSKLVGEVHQSISSAIIAGQYASPAQVVLALLTFGFVAPIAALLGSPRPFTAAPTRWMRPGTLVDVGLLQPLVVNATGEPYELIVLPDAAFAAPDPMRLLGPPVEVVAVAS